MHTLPETEHKKVLAGLALTFSAAIGVGVIVAIGSDRKNKNEDFKVAEHVNSQFGDTPRTTIRSRPTVGVDSSQNIQVAPRRVGEPINYDVLLERFSFLSNESDSAGLQLVGRGAYGRVVKAVETSTGMNVAMKIVPQTAMSAVELLNEVEVLRRVRGHDNIIHLFQVLNCEKETYLVTEICEGGELLDRLMSRGPYDEEAASALTRNIVSAIDHIHKCGYVHLDIKPENIVFAEEKGPYKKGHSADCRVVDFGTARKISEMNGNFTLSRFEDSGKIGTMAYWPPEALEGYFGNTPIESDPSACDMWALGIVLYITLLGCHPFDINGEGTELAIAKRVLRKRVDFDIYGDELSLSRSAKDILSKLLDPDPATRITAEEVMEHPFIKKGMRKEHSLNRLPSSWLHEGFKVNRSAEIDLHLENPDNRLKQYLTPESLDAFVRGLLIASATNGIKGAKITSEGLFKKAFEAVLLDPQEKEIHKRDIAALLRTTGEEHVKHFSTHPPPKRSPKRDDDGLSFEEFVAILHRNDCVTRTLDTGSIVFSKGAEPQGIYILTKGQAQVELDGHAFATLEPGDILGETSVVHGVAARKATIRCTRPSEVVYVPKELFLHALAGSSALHTRIFQVAKLQQAERVYKLMQFLRPSAIEVKTFFKGETIYTQGEEADSMYFLRKGIVGANVTANTGYNDDTEPALVRLSQRGPGDIFGLSALSVHGRRGSTMRCLTDVEVSAVSQKNIGEVAQESDLMNFYLQTQAQWRKERAQERLVDMERGVTEPQLLPLILEAQEQESGVTGSGTSSQESKDDIGQTETSRDELRRQSTKGRKSSVLRQPWEFVKSQLAKETKPPAGALEAYAKAVTEMKRESYEAGEAIFQKGEKPEKFYIVDSGTVGVEYISETGEVMTLATFGPGDHFGEQSLLENRPVYVTTVRCVTPAEVLSMDRDKFIEIVGDGETAFAKAVKSAMRQRQHLWVRNLLFLAKTQKKQQQFRGEEGGSGELFVSEPQEAQTPIQVHRIILRAGDRLFSRGDPSDAVYFIHQGELELKGDEDSDLLTSGTRILSAGDTIGLESSRDQGQKFTATCTQNKTILSKIPRETLEVLIKDHEYVSTQLKRHAEKVAPLTELDRRTKSSRVHRKFSYSSVMHQAKRE